MKIKRYLRNVEKAFSVNEGSVGGLLRGYAPQLAYLCRYIGQVEGGVALPAVWHRGKIRRIRFDKKAVGRHIFYYFRGAACVFEGYGAGKG